MSPRPARVSGRRHAHRRAGSRAGAVLVPVAAVLAVVAIVAGAYVVISATGPSGRSAQAATVSSQSLHAITLLEQERQQMIVIDAAARSGSVLAAPRLASTAAPASASDVAGTAGSVPPLGPVDPGTARADAYNMLPSFGWDPATYFGCLDNLWSKESGWRWNAENASGAYGIPQALPGSKMASAGPDWQTNPVTQIRWGLEYIKGRYGNPCAAWSYWLANGFY